jgi:hypothetical protein
VDDPGGDIGLIAAQRRYDKRNSGGQRLDHRAMAAVGDHG